LNDPACRVPGLPLVLPGCCQPKEWPASIDRLYLDARLMVVVGFTGAGNRER